MLFFSYTSLRRVCTNYYFSVEHSHSAYCLGSRYPTPSSSRRNLNKHRHLPTRRHAQRRLRQTLESLHLQTRRRQPSRYRPPHRHITQHPTPNEFRRRPPNRLFIIPNTNLPSRIAISKCKRDISTISR